MPGKIWFVTGACGGLGPIWAQAALERGDKVVVTAHSLDAVSDLAELYTGAVLPLALDSDNRNAIFAAFKKAVEHFGRIDVIVNNASYGLFEAAEALSEKDTEAQIESYIFRALCIWQAGLAIMRAQRGGHLITVTGNSGNINAAAVRLYQASKLALEGLNESILEEVSGTGIKVTLIESAEFATEWNGRTMPHRRGLLAYAGGGGVYGEVLETRKYLDPDIIADAILKIVDSAEPSLRLVLDMLALPLAPAISRGISSGPHFGAAW
jgi:NADP-dependent 3-hydroxy acid dehydrogenase YdfG